MNFLIIFAQISLLIAVCYAYPKYDEDGEPIDIQKVKFLEDRKLHKFMYANARGNTGKIKSLSKSLFSWIKSVKQNTAFLKYWINFEFKEIDKYFSKKIDTWYTDKFFPVSRVSNFIISRISIAETWLDLRQKYVPEIFKSDFEEIVDLLEKARKNVINVMEEISAEYNSLTEMVSDSVYKQKLIDTETVSQKLEKIREYHQQNDYLTPLTQAYDRLKHLIYGKPVLKKLASLVSFESLRKKSKKDIRKTKSANIYLSSDTSNDYSGNSDRSRSL